MTLRKLHGYQGVAAGMKTPEGEPFIALAETPEVLEHVFQRMSQQRFNKTQARKAIVVVPEIEEQ